MPSVRSKIKSILIEIRVWQWTKNVLVFAPLVFGAKLFEAGPLLDAILVFFAMSFAASTAYVINDLSDVNEDRKHPLKRKRPIANREISTKEALLLIIVLVALVTALSLFVSGIVLALALLYIALNLFYSKVLKHHPVIDIVIVAFFYIYRVYIGSVADNLHVSGWLVLTTFLLALFMITGKRRAEVVAVIASGKSTRKVLGLYNEKFLDSALIISLTLFIVFYSLYAVLVQAHLFIVTIFPVIYLSLRYLYVIFVKGQGEEPEKLIFKDKEILGAGIILGILVIVSLYYGSHILLGIPR